MNPEKNAQFQAPFKDRQAPFKLNLNQRSNNQPNPKETFKQDFIWEAINKGYQVKKLDAKSFELKRKIENSNKETK